MVHLSTTRSWLAALGACWLAAVPAAAQDAPADAEAREAARSHFERGVALMGNENWSAALTEFERSLELFPTRSALFNAANCKKAMHDYADALRMLREWNDRYSVAATDEERRSVTASIAELSAYLGELRIAVNIAGAQVSVDGRAIGTSPLVAPISVEIGPHVVEAVLDGYEPARHEVSVPSLEVAEVSLELVERPAVAMPDADAPPVAPDEEGLHQAWFWTAGAAAAALGIAGAATGALVLDLRNDYDASVAGCLRNETQACADGPGIVADHDEMQTTTNALLFAAGGLAATALVLAFFTDFDFGGEDEAADTLPPATASIWGMPSGDLGLLVSVEF